MSQDSAASASEPVEIVLDAPGKNALGRAVMEDLMARLDAAGDRPVLLTGAGEAFSAGLNLKEVAALDTSGMLEFLRTFDALAAKLYTYPGPTVAWVNGHAIAGGCVLALCCDRRIARRDPGIRIGLNEVALGLQFPPRTRRVVMHRVPQRFREEVILGAMLYEPKDAALRGLVDEVTDDDEAAARRWLRRLGAHPRPVYAATKAAFGVDVSVSPDEDATFIEQALPFWTSPELKARLQVLFGRR